MWEHLLSYAEIIWQACLIFPMVAAVFTLPFLIVNYRRYGGIAVMRVLVVYSFILYQMCAFLLTVLPLPSRAAVAAKPAPAIGWMPFTDLTTGLTKFGIELSSPETLTSWEGWKAYLTSSDFFQILANIVMQIPLGMYLRYYFRRTWKQALLIGFCVSLFYELTQLTGLWFIYPHAYRYASVDDLINNTLGCLVGFWLMPAVSWMLPSREEIDQLSYEKGQQITLLRRMLAAGVDWVLYGMVLTLGTMVVELIGNPMNVSVPGCGMLWFLAYFAVIPKLTGGRTPGHTLLKLRVVDQNGNTPRLWQLLARYGIMYVVEPIFFFGAVFIVLCMTLLLVMDGLTLTARLVLLAGGLVALGVCLWFPIRCWRRWHTFLHGHFSRTSVVQTGKENVPGQER